MIFVDEGIIDPELEKFIDDAIGGGDCACPLCEGSGLDYFGQECPMCDGLGECIEFISEGGPDKEFLPIVNLHLLSILRCRSSVQHPGVH